MYEGKTYEAIRSGILEGITATDKREGSFVSDMVSPISYELENVYNQFDRMLGVMFLDTSAGEYIDKRGKEYGILRKEGGKAKGECTFTGAEYTEIPMGTLCATAGGLLYEVQEDGIIGESGSITLPIIAEQTGDRYNVLAGAINILPVEIFGITGIRNENKLLGGTEREADEELAERILMRLQAPATSGNAYHYRMWAMDVEGVGNAKIFPLDNGPGTVTVLPITSSHRSPDAGIIQNIAEYIEEQRPIGATVTVLAPTEQLINVAATLEISKATTLEKVKRKYTELMESYIKGSVFRLARVDYYRCLSMFYDIEGVTAVKTFLMNGGVESIDIGEKEIQVMGTVEVAEG